MFSHQLYYTLKPFIPRWVQIFVRRMVVQRKRKLYSHVWPIDERAAKSPEGWTGWPDGKKFALILMHDVDTEKGHEKCLELMQFDEKMGFRSSFNFVPERYQVSSEVRRILVDKGFEVGVHGLKHDGKLFSSRKRFEEGAVRINRYLKDWQSVGFVSPSMHRNLDWIHALNVEYDASTFDTDPFEPQPEGVGTIFPFRVSRNPGAVEGLRLEVGGQTATQQHRNTAAPNNPNNSHLVTCNMQLATCNTEPKDSSLSTQHSTLPHCNSQPVTRNSQLVTGLHSGYIELPYTLPQDHTLFIIMGEKNIDIWKKKLDWVVKQSGMALLITHPDYMKFDLIKSGPWEYTVSHYREFLEYVKTKYKGQYWHVLPCEIARFWKDNMVKNNSKEQG
jgi:hypothetical protein